MVGYGDGDGDGERVFWERVFGWRMREGKGGLIGD